MIEKIEISFHQFKLPVAFPAAWDSHPRERFGASIIRVYDDQGRMGLGSGDSLYGFEDYASLFLNRDILDMDLLCGLTDNVSFHAGRWWALENALWDLHGKTLGEPLYQILGGRSDRVRAYASSGVLRSPAEMADLAQRVLDRGFPALKIRFGREHLDEDLAVVSAIRDRVGYPLRLMIDCNQGWRMPWDVKKPWRLEDAATLAKKLEPFDIFWMEEPLHRGDYEGMEQLREETKIAIAGAEMTREIHELEWLIERHCLDVLQPDVTLVGGIGQLKAIAHMAESNQMLFTPHTWGNGIGLLANAHLAAGATHCPYLEFPFDPPEWSPSSRDFMLVEPIETDQDGWLSLPSESGLGLRLNEDILAQTKVWTKSVTR